MFGTPAFSTAATISSPSATFMASGFSQRIILPALAAASTISLCGLFGEPMSISVDVLARDQLSPVGLVRLVAPVLGERFDLVFIAAADRP